MVFHSEPSLAVVLAFGVASAACRDEAPKAAQVFPAPPPAPLQAAVEKIGMRFVRVPSEGGVDFIATNAARCSPGEHQAVRCPPTTPLSSVESNGAHVLNAYEASLTDAVTAHRVCAMRFGGRLPTPLERAAMRGLRGLASLLVVESTDPSRRFQFLELPEWTEEGACSNPSVPGEGCALTPFPRETAAHALAWDHVLQCDARRVTPSASTPVTELGKACPALEHLQADGGPQELPCLLRVPGPPTGAPQVYALTCWPFDPKRARPDDPAVAPAAFRCSVPAIALAAQQPVGGPAK